MIIAISGYAGSGKDTAATIIQFLTATGGDGPKGSTVDQFLGYKTGKPSYNGGSPWQIKKFADPVRQVAAILLGMDIDYLYTDEFKQSILFQQWNYTKLIMEANNGKDDVYGPACMTGREFLQRLGTEAIRDGLHPNAWVNALMSKYKCACNNCRPAECNRMPKWIITDLRFPNELFAIKERKGITIRITSSRKHKMNHPSELALDDAPFDYYIDNSGTMDELKDQLYGAELPFRHIHIPETFPKQ
jgi:hypothetical protein